MPVPARRPLAVRLHHALHATREAIDHRRATGAMDAAVPHIRVRLGERDHRTAGHAHLAGLPVPGRGRLERRGGFRGLTGASRVVVVPERDRLLKTLQENPGFPEETGGDG